MARHVHALCLLQSLAEEQSRKLQKITEDLAIAQDELDQQRRLNETLIKRKVF